jgi:site-specific DNA recombinase
MENKSLHYIRVSTRGQAVDGYSIEFQKDECRKYSLKHGFEAVGELVDVCSGAIPMMERPQGKDLYNRIVSGAFDYLVMYDSSRSSRDAMGIELLLLKDLCHKNGIIIHFTDTGEDRMDLGGNVLDVLNSWKNAQERASIRMRSMDGKNKKAKDGKKWVGCTAPYGYKKIGIAGDTYLEIDPIEAGIVQWIFDNYIGKNGVPRLSMQRLAIELNAKGIPSPQNGNWYGTNIERIILYRTYIGELIYKGRDPKTNQLTEYKTLMPELRIIDDNTWNLAQAQRIRNKERAKRNGKYNYLLTSFIRCACGGTLCGIGLSDHYKDKVYFTRYYKCSAQLNMVTHRIKNCRQKSIRLDIAEPVIWNWVYGIISDENKLRAGLREMIRRTERDLEPKRNRLASINSLIAQTETRMRRLVTRLGDEEDEIIAATVQADLNTAKRQRDALIQESGMLQAELTRVAITPEVEAQIIEGIARMALKKIDEITFEEKRAILERLHFRGKLRVDENGHRFMDVTLAFTQAPVSISLDNANPCVRL